MMMASPHFHPSPRHQLTDLNILAELGTSLSYEGSIKLYRPLISIAFIGFASTLTADTPVDHKTIVSPGEALIGKDPFTWKGPTQCHRAGGTQLPKVAPEPR